MFPQSVGLISHIHLVMCPFKMFRKGSTPSINLHVLFKEPKHLERGAHSNKYNLKSDRMNLLSLI